VEAVDGAAPQDNRAWFVGIVARRNAGDAVAVIMVDDLLSTTESGISVQQSRDEEHAIKAY
jgi:hypothetical protein